MSSAVVLDLLPLKEILTVPSAVGINPAKFKKFRLPLCRLG
jgi:hypothetical protein